MNSHLFHPHQITGSCPQVNKLFNLKTLTKTDTLLSIVFIDYFQYSVVWGCSNLPENRSMESFWILSRTPQLPENAVLNARIESLVDRYVDRENIRFTEQNDAV